MKLRRKSIVVDAFRLTRDVEVISPSWFVDAVIREKIFFDRSIVDGAAVVYGCTVETGTGKLNAKIGDYVIRGPDGELSVCKHKDLKTNYEVVN